MRLAALVILAMSAYCLGPDWAVPEGDVAPAQVELPAPGRDLSPTSGSPGCRMPLAQQSPPTDGSEMVTNPPELNPSMNSALR